MPEIFGNCPMCYLPLVESLLAEHEAVCDSGHRYRYTEIEPEDDSDPTYYIGTFIGHDPK